MWSLQKFPFQAFYLVYYSGYMPVLLFLPLYLKYNGLSTVQVGLLTGLRPLLQSIGSPILVKLSARFRVKKVLFVVSCLIMIGKFFVIFIVLRPKQQLCRTKYSNGDINDRFIHHKVSKRADFMDEWSLNYTASNVSFQYYDKAKAADSTLLRNINSTFRNNNSRARKPDSPMKKKNIQVSNESHTTPASLTKPNIKIQYRINRDDEVHLIFITILALSLATDYFDAVVLALVDNAYRPSAMYKGIWAGGDVVWGVITLIIGVTIDQTAREICGQMVASFHYVFYFLVAFLTIALFIGLRLDLTVDPYEADLTRKIQRSTWNFQYNIFILVYALMGFCNGFLFAFLYWFIDTLGGNAMIMGLSTACECLMGLVAFFLVQPIIDYIGHMSIVCVGFVGYIGLFLSYYKMNNPWLVISAKILQGSVSGLMMFACNSFLKEATPAGSSYQMQETLHGIYWGIGMAIGAVFSGFTIDNYYFPLTFLWFTLITCIISFLFLAIQLYVVCTEGRSMSDIGSESSSNNSSQFGDDEEEVDEDVGSGYEW